MYFPLPIRVNESVKYVKYHNITYVVKTYDITRQYEKGNYRNAIYWLKKGYEFMPRYITSWSDNFHAQIVMTYEGDSLQERKLNTGIKYDILNKIIKMFQSLRENGIYYQDIKPSNICIRLVGNTPLIKLLDVESIKGHSNANTITYSVKYASPEILIKKWHHNSDSWSLGVMLYVLLTGEHPFNWNEVSNKMDDKKYISGWLSNNVKNIDIDKVENLYYRDMISKLLVNDADRRLSIVMI